MKKLYLFTLLFTAFNTFGVFAQTDLELVKPIIHIADSLNGGYYGGLSSVYTYSYTPIPDSSTQLYTGAIVRNNGQDTVTHYFLKVNAFIDYAIAGNGSSVNITRYSDTLAYLAPGAVDTIRLPKLSISSYVNGWDSWNNTRLSYQLFHDSVDVTPENDSVSLPTIYYRNDNVFRLGEINDTINLINHPQYPSGSFIGITTPAWLASYFWGEIMFLGVANTSTLQNINIEFRLYVNDSLLITFIPNPTPYFSSYPSYPPVASLDSNYYIQSNFYSPSPLWHDSSSYTVGIYFEYDTAIAPPTPLLILADTGNYHTFEVETRALINGSWQSMDFVPLIFRDLFWEGIEEYQNSAEVYWFPNPAREQTTLRIRQPNLKNYPATVTVLDITGKQVLSAKVTNNQSIDISALSQGVYMVLTHINGQRFAAKLIKP